MKFKILLAAALIAGAAAPLCAEELTENNQQENKQETELSNNLLNVIKGAENLASRIEINGYVQGGYDYQSSDNSNTFNYKRAIVWAKAKITDKWSFLYMHDFKASSLEYYTAYSFNKALNVRMGQFKNSLSMENAMSPSKLEIINCYSQPVMYMTGFNDPLVGPQGGRDIGLMIYGEAGNTGLKYELGVMNGQGINKNDGNREKDFILKLDYSVCPGLRIVTSGQLGRGHAIADSPYNGIHKDQNYKRNRLTAGFEYVSKPLSLRAEWLKGWDGCVQSQGVYATAQAPVCNKLDAIASYDYLSRNTHSDLQQANYAVGLQYWFYKRCRIQAQYTRCCPGNAKDYNMVQFQTQVFF